MYPENKTVHYLGIHVIVQRHVDMKLPSGGTSWLQQGKQQKYKLKGEYDSNSTKSICCCFI